ncbi:hypothetical protein JD844_031520 [Phrynosoma platyrhinos]|uniref:Uncharacterized protein n=1 Tax=Phrynosoma platyrhinos TaxID=52577 RepID=A0ABQ7T1E1_PHRPL|nr:hypothetical protein JD844_031520 [Phrynosoma platyrhinos]
MGSVNTTQSSFVPLPGSPTVSSYYGIRRSLMAEMDLQTNRQISSDVYASSLIAKPFAYDSPAVQGYPSLLDTHFIDQYIDHRATSRDTWDQSLPDSLSPSDTCSESLQVPPVSSASCLSSHEPGTSSQYRSPSWSSSISGAQPYSFHTLEDVHYAAGYSASSPYPFSSLVTPVGSDFTPKGFQASSEDPSDATATSLHDSSPLWPKEDGNPLWGSYECRRTY